MEFIAYLETTEEYDASNVVDAFHKMMKLAPAVLLDAGHTEFAAIIADISNTSSVIEEDTH